MAGTKLTPEKITSPFQLMAAWFSMLILLVSVLLTAAVNITRPDWAAGYLVIFSSIITVGVISCVTLMLTLFRPHLQEGKEYAQWLKDKNAYSPGLIVQERATPKRARQSAGSTSSASAGVDRSIKILVNTRCPGSDDLITALRRSQFFAGGYASPMEGEQDKRSPEEATAIWVGSRLQAAAVIEAMKLAVAVWPHLKYVSLSTDGSDPPDEVHEQLFFGGATSTALNEGLQPWSADEIRALSSDLPQTEFHRAIRAKYS